MDRLYTLIHLINTYRLHVITVFALLLANYSYQFYGFFFIPTIPTSPAYYIALLAFTCTWAAFYIGNKYFDFKEDQISQMQEARRSTTLAGIVIALYVIPFLLLASAQLPLLPLACLVVLTILYSIPIGNTRIKNITFGKNAYAAATWWIAVALFVSYYTASNLSFSEALLYSINVLFLLLAIEIVWDIRDVVGDRAVGNYTLPVVFGLRKTKLILALILLVAWWWNGLSVTAFFSFNILYLLLVTVFLEQEYPIYYYHSIIYIEGMFLMTQIISAYL